MNNPFAGANLDNVKEMNISLVLKKIFSEKGISRTDIASSTEMSRAFVTKVTSILAEHNIITEEKNNPLDVGRPRVSLSFNGKGYAMLGLRINRTYISSALCDADGEMLCHYTNSLTNDMSGEEIYSICKMLLQKAYGSNADRIVLGIGIAAPGPIPVEHDRVTALKSSTGKGFAEFSEIPLVRRIEEDFGLSAILLHDAHCGAINEYIFSEKDEKFRNIAFIATDTGVGAGIIIDGSPYNGSGGLAGEISHMIIGYDGEFGSVGNFLSQERLVEACECSSLDEVLKAVEAGNERCCEKFDTFVRYLSVVMANLITTVSPEAIVVSDKIAVLRERVYGICLDTMKTLIPESYIKSTRIIVRPNSIHSVLRGACGAILHKALEEPCKYFLI